jgi:hypothetical protein
MTKKTESPKKSKSTPAAKITESSRAYLLARVAGDIAAGIVSAPSDSADTAEAIAAIAVDIAEEILKQAGL